MKKIFALALALALIICLAACGDDDRKVVGDDNDDKNSAVILPDVNSVPSTPAPEEHVHTFMPPSCTAPATCTCGATQGEPMDHQWNEATCETPAICGVCGITGEFGDHVYPQGSKECSVCHSVKTGSPVTEMYIDGDNSSFMQTTATNIYFEDKTTDFNNYHIVLTATETVTDFKFFEIAEVWDENYEYCTIVKTNLFVQSELTPARTITISSYFNDAVPNRGYSFVDQYGELHEFECQMDMIG